MFKRKKKKTGCETPEYRRPTLPPNPNLGYQPTKASGTKPPKPPTSGSNAQKRGYGQVDLEKVVAPIFATSFEEHYKPKRVNIVAAGTEDGLDALLSMHDDMLKIENAYIYWSEKDGMIAVCTTREWVDYLTGKRNTPFIEKENNKCKD